MGKHFILKRGRKRPPDKEMIGAKNIGAIIAPMPTGLTDGPSYNRAMKAQNFSTGHHPERRRHTEFVKIAVFVSAGFI